MRSRSIPVASLQLVWLAISDLRGEGAVRISPSLAVRSSMPKRRSLGTSGSTAVEEEVVELGAGLAADLDGVFESGGGDQSGARAFAFKQRVGADGGAVSRIMNSP